MLDPMLRARAPSGLVIDAKSLYDSVKKEIPVQSTACKRTAVGYPSHYGQRPQMGFIRETIVRRPD